MRFFADSLGVAKGLSLIDHLVVGHGQYRIAKYVLQISIRILHVLVPELFSDPTPA